jgi:hypothetical protein
MIRRHATKIDAVLRHLAAGADLQDFPGTKFEKLALVRTAGRRGLIAWDATRSRYELTPAGWSELSPRRFGLPSLVVSTALGASIGAAALAFLWLPGVQWRDSAQGHARLVSRLEKPIAAPASPPADVGGRSLAPMQASASPAAPAALAPGAAPADPIEPAQIAGQPGSEQPATEAAPTNVKQAAGKKSHRRTARHGDRTNSAWGFGNAWRGRQSAQWRYTQDSRFTYR